MKKYNWGILAPGRIAHKFASDLKLLPNANCYAVGSRSMERAGKFASEFGFQKAYGSYEELANDPNIDIVYIASPHTGHYEHTMLCLASGKAVLCEKPIAINTGQFERMHELAQEKELFLMEALWTRFIPSFIRFKEIIDSGIIGEIKLIESDFSFKPPYNPEGRLFNLNLGGGALLDVGIYPVFMALELADEPQRMECMATLGKTGVDETCSMSMQHPKNMLSILFTSIVNSGRTETLVHGDKGYIRLNSMWHMPSTIDLFCDDSEPEHFSFEEPGFGYQYEAKHVMDCLDEGKTESDVFSMEKSLRLLSTLDKIREQIGLIYPTAVEAV